jgi:two-component system, response regulator PdtaR
MRALIVEGETLLALRWVDTLTSAGISIIGPARSSGEAWVLAAREQPDVVILRADLESIGAGRRLADKLSSELNLRCLIATEHDLKGAEQPRDPFAQDQIPGIALAARTAGKTR